VKVGGILFVALGVFVLVAGIVYGVWGYELSGTFYLCVLGVAFMYLAHVLLHAARDEPRDTEDETATVPAGDGGGHGSTAAMSREALEPVPVKAHASPPALTPFLFAVSAGFVALGLVFSRWLVLSGALILATVAAVWLYETAPRRPAHHDEHAGGEGEHAEAHEAASEH
jgi:membrane protein implicated in regulation of membrane protease activity